MSYGAFDHFGFSLYVHGIVWRECWLSSPVSCDHGIVHLDCFSIKIFSLLGVFSDLIFILWGFHPMVLLYILAFLCQPTWSHEENVDCPHLYHVIMGSYTFIVGVLKYFLFWFFVPFDFYPLWLLSFSAYVHFSFSLSAHVIAWRKCWLATTVSCYHGIIHLHCWSIKIFSLLGVLSALIFIFWYFRPLELFSILAFPCPNTWSHDENVDCPHLYHVFMGSYTLIVGVLKYFLSWGFCPLWFLSFGSFVLWCFCPF